METCAEVEDLEPAVYGHGGPVFVAEVGVAERERAEGGDAEEGREGEVGVECWVGRDVGVV